MLSFNFKKIFIAGAVIFSKFALANSSLSDGDPFPKTKAKAEQSVLFKRVSDGKVIFARDPQKPLSPASISKLLIAGTALDKFSPNFQFNTQFFHDGTYSSGVIKGNLYIKGSGDPMLINEIIWQIAADLKHLGLRQVTGDLIIDDTIFDRETFDRSRQSAAGRSRNAYDAPISGFSTNFNTFPIAFAPGQKGKSGLVNIDPYPFSDLNIVNQTRTVSGTRANVQAVRATNAGQSKLVASGQIGVKSALKKLYRSVAYPSLRAGEVVRGFLQHEGIVIKGEVKRRKIAQTARLLYEKKGFELRRMITGLNRYSNNFIADMLLKGLAAYHSSSRGLKPASRDEGLQLMTDFLQKKIGLKGRMQIYNGSGLDTRNRLSAEQMVDFLSYMASRFDLFPDFLASLPASGWDGTLKKRFQLSGLRELKGYIRAKTGTLSQPIAVSSLAGYFRHERHGLIAFAIIENGVSRQPQPSIASLRRGQDLAIYNILKRF